MTRFKALTPSAQGILLFIGAFLMMSIMDVMAKELSGHVPVLQAVWARYTGQTVVVFLIVLPRIGTVARSAFPGLQALRSLFLLAATSCFFFGVSLLGLAEATAIMNVSPVLITLGAALFLGERLGIRRATAVALALIGALIIIRPGGAVFSVYSALPLIAAFFYSGYALVTRFVGRGEDVWTSLLYTALAGAVVLSGVMPWVWERPDATAVALMALIGIVGATGQLLLIRALVLVEASALAPFSYVSLVFATAWGALVFGEYPDAPTYLGALVIAGAGIYVWHRETRGRT